MKSKKQNTDKFGFKSISAYRWRCNKVAMEKLFWVVEERDNMASWHIDNLTYLIGQKIILFYLVFESSSSSKLCMK